MHREVSPYREVTPFDTDMLDEYKEISYECHDELVEMGGRPTRSVREKPAGKAIYKEAEGIIDIVDEHGKVTCNLEYGMDPVIHHWIQECYHFEQELERWKEFQDYQHKNPHLPPLMTAFEMGDTHETVKAILIRLNEWREFETYHQCKVNTALMSTWRNRQALGKLFCKEGGMSEQAASDPETQSSIQYWLEQLFPKQIGLEACQKQLKCIENQGFEILSEAGAAIKSEPVLCQQLEKKMAKQANGVYQELKRLEARPILPVQSPSITVPYVQRLLHWNSETSRLLNERRQWKIFLRWRKTRVNASPPISTIEKQPNQRTVDSVLWFDYVAYQQSELDNARTLIDCWQRLQMSQEEEIEALQEAGQPIVGGSLQAIHKYLELFQQDARTAEVQVQSAQQQSVRLCLPQSLSDAHDLPQQTTDCQNLPPTPRNSDACGSRSADRDYLKSSTSPSRFCLPQHTHGASGPVYPPGEASEIGEKPAEKGKIDKGKLTIVSDIDVLDQVKVDDDIQMTDAPDISYQHDLIGASETTEPLDTVIFSVEDNLMTDTDDYGYNTSPFASRPDSKGRDSRNKKNPPFTVHQTRRSSKARSATKIDQTVSSRVIKTPNKNTNTKVAKKAKTFTEKQTMVLLNATSIGDSPPEELPMPIHRPPSPRKTRSTPKLDQVISSKVTKTANKTKTKFTKTSTKQQRRELLHTALPNDSSANSSSPRRSERLRKIAATSK